MSRLTRLLFWPTLFAVSMAFLESAVVVYLRELYYPYGFAFPLKSMSGIVVITEVFRELATLLMLLSVAVIAGATSRQRLAWFIYCFAVWDIFYYVFLKVLLNWPESWLTWDLLFLIPTAWTGPVIVPLLVSGAMILFALVLLTRISSGIHLPVMRISLWITIGALLVFVSMIWDFTLYMQEQSSLSSMFRIRLTDQALSVYVPKRFPWLFFIPGMVFIFAGIADFFRNTQPLNRS